MKSVKIASGVYQVTLDNLDVWTITKTPNRWRAECKDKCFHTVKGKFSAETKAQIMEALERANNK